MTSLQSLRIDAFAYDIPAERPWSRVLRKGQTLRIIDSEGQQAVDALLYCADDPAERYSSQDTLRVQGSAYVELGTRLISNKGRVMAQHRGRFLRTARHVGRMLLLRKQCGPLRRGDQISTCLPRKFHPRTVETRPDQARYRLESELLHERADRSFRKFHRRRRHLGAGQLCRGDRRHGRAIRHLQLSAGE